MFDDPKALTTANWQDISAWLTFFWIYVPVVFTFAVTLLTAHAIIPSLIRTGHIPQGTNKLRIPMTAFAAVLFVVAAALMVMVVIAELAQPLPSVPVTVNISPVTAPVTVGF